MKTSTVLKNAVNLVTIIAIIFFALDWAFSVPNNIMQQIYLPVKFAALTTGVYAINRIINR